MGQGESNHTNIEKETMERQIDKDGMNTRDREVEIEKEGEMRQEER